MDYKRKYQTLRLVFLDWARAFDRLQFTPMLEDLITLGLPRPSAGLLHSLLHKPVFRVAMNGDLSAWKNQRVG
eukprot:1312931-Alexandrium_andersonii.AAC.1